MIDIAKAKKSWERLYGTLLVSDTKTGLVQNYTDYAIEYDQCLRDIGYNIPKALTSLVMRERNLDSGQSVLDVGAGTGWIGKQLREMGFTGVIDALDASEGMLTVAKSTGIYREVITQFITHNCDLDVEGRSYDVVISAGCFTASHIPAECVKVLLASVKKGGLLAFSIRAANKNDKVRQAYTDNILRVVSELCDDNFAKKVAIDECDFYAVNFASDQPTIPLKGTCVCLRKL